MKNLKEYIIINKPLIELAEHRVIDINIEIPYSL